MNKVKIRREENQVIVERTYEVVPNRSVHFDNRPKIDFSIIKSYVLRAIKARMEHCFNQLDTKILPAEDKIFNEMGAIFSPSKGLYFNQQSFESMESALGRIEKNSTDELFLGLDLRELDQVTKALIAFGEPLSTNEAHYLSGWIMEALMVSARGQFSK
jgi:hypothetical protein